MLSGQISILKWGICSRLNNEKAMHADRAGVDLLMLYFNENLRHEVRKIYFDIGVDGCDGWSGLCARFGCGEESRA